MKLGEKSKKSLWLRKNHSLPKPRKSGSRLSRTGNFAALAAVKEKGVLTGVCVERNEQGSPGEFADLENMTADVLRAFVAKTARARLKGPDRGDPQPLNETDNSFLTGAHHELSDKEKTNLAKEEGTATLEDMLEQAFEAGIACVLGDEGDDPPESAKDADLRRLLLRPLIEDGAAKRLMQRDILSRAALTTLIRNAAALAPDGEISPARQ
jgi:hypothetical protein